MKMGIVIGLILALPALSACANLRPSAASEAVEDSNRYCKALKADHRLDPIRQKMNFGGEPTFAMLTDDSRPTAEEKPAIAAWAELTAQCVSYTRSRAFPHLPPQVTAVWEAAASVAEGYKADLYRGALTWGEYARKSREYLSQVKIALADIENALRVQGQNAQFQADILANQARARLQQERQFQEQQLEKFMRQHRSVTCQRVGNTTFCN